MYDFVKKNSGKNFWYCSNEGAKTDSEGRQQNILVQLLHSLSKVDSLCLFLKDWYLEPFHQWKMS